jgi:hypothetical protein
MNIFKHVVCTSLVLFSLSTNAAEPSSDIILNRAFVAAMNQSKKGGVDFNIYEKIINNKLQNYGESLKIEEISVEKFKFLIFRENSKAGALFIADQDGQIIFHAEEWGVEHKVIYPFEKNPKFFAITRQEPRDRPGEHKEYIYIFEANQKSAKNVLAYLNNTEYCIMNPMLPRDTRENLEGNFYNGCSAKAVVKKFTPTEAQIQYTYKLEKDFLTDEQYKEVLKFYPAFSSKGEAVFNWTYKRPKGKPTFKLTRGRTTHPITKEDTSIKTF